MSRTADAPPPYYEDLDAIWSEVRARMVRGVRDRRSALHLMTVATTDDECRPRLRTVVLRGVSPGLDEVSFHTDARSAKFAELAARPACALALYDPRACIQLRLEGEARLHRGDPIALEAWEKSTPSARQCYAIEPAPGTVLEGPQPGAASLAEACVRERFVKVVVAVGRVEWLYLRASGHRRARFTRNGDTFEGHWLVP